MTSGTRSQPQTVRKIKTEKREKKTVFCNILDDNHQLVECECVFVAVFFFFLQFSVTILFRLIFNHLFYYMSV